MLSRERGDIGGYELGGRYLYPCFPFDATTAKVQPPVAAEHDITLTADSATTTRGNTGGGLALLERSGTGHPSPSPNADISGAPPNGEPDCGCHGHCH